MPAADVRQGDVFWVDFGEPRGSEPGYRRPCVVVQNGLFNQSRLRTVVVCALTSTIWLAARPGNVALDVGEANLSKPSVVNVTQIFTVDRSALGQRVGVLSRRRVEEVVRGIGLVLRPRGPVERADG